MWLSMPNGLTRKQKGLENQNWCKRFPGQKKSVCQFTVQKDKDQGWGCAVQGGWHWANASI